MDDLRTMLTIVAKHKAKLLVICFLAIAALLFYPRAHIDSVEVSPDLTYRLEFYRPSLLQYLRHVGMRSPGFVRLYRNFDNHYVGESDVVDFVGGAGIRWNMTTSGQIDVGRDVEFTNVPPVGPGSIVLKIPKPNE
ncbi:MAG: hypothetical protein HY308_09100 [Gammaproteobacteria bacterium]|nr:hypothetical protein [Gammaproteobacteria bacterium]